MGGISLTDSNFMSVLMIFYFLANSLFDSIYRYAALKVSLC